MVSVAAGVAVFALSFEEIVKITEGDDILLLAATASVMGNYLDVSPRDTVVEGHGTAVKTLELSSGMYIVSYSITGNREDGIEDNFIAAIQDSSGAEVSLVNEIVDSLSGSVTLPIGENDEQKFFLSVKATGDWRFEFSRQ